MFVFQNRQAPFTRYNLLSNRLYNPVWQPAVSCKRGINQLFRYASPSAMSVEPIRRLND